MKFKGIFPLFLGGGGGSFGGPPRFPRFLYFVWTYMKLDDLLCGFTALLFSLFSFD